MKLKMNLSILCLIFALFIVSCEDKDETSIIDEQEQNPDQNPNQAQKPDSTASLNTYKTLVFKGFIQKGPAVKGDSVEIQVVDSNMNAVGAPVKTVIKGDNGEYEVEVDSISATDNVIVSYSGDAYDEKSGEVKDSADIQAVVAVDTSKDNTVNVNTITDAVAEEVMEDVKNGEYKGNLNETTEKVIGTMLEALQITDSSIINYYKDPSQINLNEDALLYTLSLVFGDDLNKKFLEPYATINQSNAAIWLSTMIGEGGRQLFESIRKYEEYTEEKNIEQPDLDLTTPSFAAVIKSVLMRDAADNLGSLSIRFEDLGLNSYDSLSTIKTKLIDLGLDSNDIDSSYFKFHLLSSTNMQILSSYFGKDVELTEGLRIQFVVDNPQTRSSPGNSIDNINALLKAGAIYAGVHALGEEIE
jgi:PBP1b-binding outer membrane lipoprotein LpoB